MKTITQATGLMATALLITTGLTTGCEFPTDNEEPYEKIVYLGKIISTPIYATFSSPLGIEHQISIKKIRTIQIDFENQRIHYYGNTTTNEKCYFDRPLEAEELSTLETQIRDLEFCELQSNKNIACLASFMPTESILIYDYSKLHYADEFSNYCEANSAQLCNGADIKPLFATIKEWAVQDLNHCESN